MRFFTRRHFTAALALGSVVAFTGLSGGSALAQEAKETVSVDELMKPGPLGDRSLGKEDAPVTIVEYASMSCSHCADFHNETYPELKEQYIDTGKVHFIFREFPIDAAAYGIAMAARCAPENRYFDVIDLFFEHQMDWMRAEDRYAAILDLAKQVGFSEDSFEACLQNQALFDGLTAGKDRAVKDFGVQGTPTFFINGEKNVGALSFDQLKQEIDKNL
ncbi:DsbA family protein [Afifella sp. IM 167]|uniref:DsbA family protein n=1 Tax=Afifella sp. IM 167 TaxID=2033586 RepID=UPI001CCF0C15|nr:DsbA family protein [Afifella sp. IM 167]MBZ8133354.1 disulfide bond formation protein DsbA [Afifella sp. IM 167]